jgi:hypothetical protein
MRMKPTQALTVIYVNQTGHKSAAIITTVVSGDNVHLHYFPETAHGSLPALSIRYDKNCGANSWHYIEDEYPAPKVK